MNMLFRFTKCSLCAVHNSSDDLPFFSPLLMRALTSRHPLTSATVMPNCLVSTACLTSLQCTVCVHFHLEIWLFCSPHWFVLLCCFELNSVSTLLSFLCLDHWNTGAYILGTQLYFANTFSLLILTRIHYFHYTRFTTIQYCIQFCWLILLDV